MCYSNSSPCSVQIGWQRVAKEESGGFFKCGEEQWSQQGNKNAGIVKQDIKIFLSWQNECCHHTLMFILFVSSAGLAQWERITEGRDSKSAGSDLWSGQQSAFLFQVPYVFVFPSVWHTLSLPPSAFDCTHAGCLPTGFGPVSEEVCMDRNLIWTNKLLVY